MRASEMRKGQTIKVDGRLFWIVDYQHVKLGKCGGQQLPTNVGGAGLASDEIYGRRIE